MDRHESRYISSGEQLAVVLSHDCKLILCVTVTGYSTELVSTVTDFHTPFSVSKMATSVQ